MFYDNDIDTFFTDFAFPVTTANNQTFNVIQDIEYYEGNAYASPLSINFLQISGRVKNTDITACNLDIGVIVTINQMQYEIKNIEFDNRGISAIKFYIVEE